MRLMLIKDFALRITNEMKFGDVKKALIALNLICKNRMVWRRPHSENPTLISALHNPELFLSEYVRITGQDPRRWVPVIYAPNF